MRFGRSNGVFGSSMRVGWSNWAFGSGIRIGGSYRGRPQSVRQKIAEHPGTVLVFPEGTTQALPHPKPQAQP